MSHADYAGAYARSAGGRPGGASRPNRRRWTSTNATTHVAGDRCVLERTASDVIRLLRI